VGSTSARESNDGSNASVLCFRDGAREIINRHLRLFAPSRNYALVSCDPSRWKRARQFEKTSAGSDPAMLCDVSTKSSPFGIATARRTAMRH